MTTKHFLLAGLGLMALAGCGSGGDNGGSTGGDVASNGGGKGAIEIAVIPKGSTHDYWKHVHQGADEAAAELKKQGTNVTITFQGPQVESDKNSQINMMDTMISKGVKGIVLAPLDDKALVASVEKAAGQNIPVVVIDSDVNTDKYISFVATDNEKGGHMAAAQMIKLLGPKGGRIAVLRYNAGSASTDKREKGFIDEIQASGKGITIVSMDQYAGPTRESAAKSAENMLAAFVKPDGSPNLDGIYCPNESSTAGMLKVLEGKNWAGKVKFMGFDASPDLVEALNKGEIDGLIVQNPDKMGHDGVMTIVNYITGKNKSPDKKEDTGAYLVTKDNDTQPDIAPLIAPAKL